MSLKISDRILAKGTLILMLAGFSGLLFYVLSCVVSPVSWSPDSSKIALLVTPFDNDINFGGIFTYEVGTGERVLIDKFSEGEALSGPAWSPDGKWIAYYKAFEPKKETSAETTKEKREGIVSEVFSEDNMMLPGFIYDAGKGMMEEYDETKPGEVILVVMSWDGTEKKSEKVLQWLKEDDTGAVIYMQPQWSPDSRRVYYLRLLDEIGYVGSMNIETGDSQGHVFTQPMFWAVSPDGEWIGAALEDTLIVYRTDGKVCNYYAMEISMDGEVLTRSLGWSPDSEKILFGGKDEFVVVDAETGESIAYKDETAEEVGYPVFSREGDSLIYLAKYSREEVGGSKDIYEVRSMNLDSGEVVCVMIVNKIESGKEQTVGDISFSPDGKTLIVRLAADAKDGKGDDKQSKLIIWDGKEKRVVETDSWLKGLGVEGETRAESVE